VSAPRILRGEELESAVRKVNLVLGVSGEGEQRVSILVNALASVSADMNLDMASVIHALTDAYLSYVENFEDDDEDDDYD
jgi:hypothetical protein